jgi:hypothetical protein
MLMINRLISAHYILKNEAFQLRRIRLPAIVTGIQGSVGGRRQNQVTYAVEEILHKTKAFPPFERLGPRPCAER